MTKAAAATAFIGLGSNLDGPRDHVVRACDELTRLPQTHLERCSSLYLSRPLGPGDQPDYVNAVARVRTCLPPLVLLRQLQALERAHGRERGGPRWGPRTLDLDLLLYDRVQLDLPELEIPHPGIAERGFVLYPLQELNPDLVVPGRGGLGALVRACAADGLVRLRA